LKHIYLFSRLSLDFFGMKSDQINMQARLGNCWSQIARFLPGRSDNSVKNRWYCALIQRQVQRQGRSSCSSRSSSHERADASPEAREVISSSSSPEPSGLFTFMRRGPFHGGLCLDTTTIEKSETLADKELQKKSVQRCHQTGIRACEEEGSGREDANTEADDYMEQKFVSMETVNVPLSDCDYLETRTCDSENKADNNLQLSRKRCRDGSPKIHHTTASSDSLEAAIGGGESNRFAEGPQRILPRRNLLRGISRVETPGSPGRHVRHGWLLRQLLSHDPASGGGSFLSSLNGNTTLPLSSFARNEWSLDPPASDSNEVESSGGGIGVMTGGGRVMWPGPLEDSAAWISWPAEESWIGGSAANLAVCNPAPGAPIAIAPDAAEYNLAEADLLLACPAQFFIPTRDD
jgi:hypothetical protein